MEIASPVLAGIAMTGQLNVTEYPDAFTRFPWEASQVPTRITRIGSQMPGASNRAAPTSPARQPRSPAVQPPPTPHGRRDTNRRSYSRARRAAARDCGRRSAPSSSRPRRSGSQRSPFVNACIFRRNRSCIASESAAAPARILQPDRTGDRPAPRIQQRIDDDWLPLGEQSLKLAVWIVVAPGTVVGVSPARSACSLSSDGTPKSASSSA